MGLAEEAEYFAAVEAGRESVSEELTELRQDISRARAERDALASAIGEAVVSAGIASNVPMTGPELICMVESMTAALAAAQSLRAEAEAESDRWEQTATSLLNRAEAAEGKVERLKRIVTAMEEGCVSCQYPKRVEELTCQKNAGQQVIAERDEYKRNIHGYIVALETRDAELAELRADLTRAREDRQTVVDNAMSAARLSYDQGRESMREEAAETVARKADDLTRCGSFIAVATFRAIASDIRAIPIKEGE